MSDLEHRPEGLSWAKSPWRELIRLGWPIAVSMLSYSVMTLVDTLFVGRIGASALAGVGLAGTAAFTILCFSMGLLRGVKVLVSQSKGAGQPEQAQRAYLGAGLGLAAGLGGISLGIGFAVAPGLELISDTQAAGQYASGYLQIRMLGAPLFLAAWAMKEALQGQGDATTPMRASLVANGINIGLDALFILGLGWGVEGAAWATVISHAVELAWLAATRLKGGLGLDLVRSHHLAQIVRVGLSTGAQMALEVGSFAILAALVATMGDHEMAAHQIALQVIHFSFLPAWAISEACSVMTGQAVGADRDDLVRPVAHKGLILAGAYTGLATAILVLGSGAIASLFKLQPEVTLTATHLLWVAAGFQIADGANMIARGALRGTGDVRTPAIIGIVSAWLCTPPMTWLLGIWAGLGALGGWIGLWVEIGAGAGILWWRLERGGWRPLADQSRQRLASQGDERAPKAGSGPSPLVVELEADQD